MRCLQRIAYTSAAKAQKVSKSKLKIINRLLVFRMNLLKQKKRNRQLFQKLSRAIRKRKRRTLVGRLSLTLKRRRALHQTIQTIVTFLKNMLPHLKVRKKFLSLIREWNLQVA